jgi:predicted enzyme related to lactoylglutathione lyase
VQVWDEAHGAAHPGAAARAGLTEGALVARPNFIELPARDLAASRAFFETVFGMAMTGFGPTYACTLTGDVDIGLQADRQEATKAPLPVIEVKDLEATLAAVTAAGAPVTKPIFSFPGGRRFHFLDPGGNELAAMQADAQ